MNILQIVSSLEEISGPANSLYLVATGLAESGHEVICAHYLGKQGPLVRRLEQQRIKVIDLNPRMQSNSRINHLKILLKLIKIVWQYRIQVIHAHSWDADCYAFLTAFFKKIKVVVTLHSRSYFNWVNSHKLKYEMLFFKKNVYFACVSKVMTEEFKQITRVPKNKVKVVYNCPLNIFFNSPDKQALNKIRQEFQIDDSEFLMGSVGNFTKLKGIIYLLEALAELKNNKCKLLLVGADVAGLKPEFDKFLNEKKISQQVIFAGFRQDIPEILDAIDLFVFPSIEEADPIALSEAMARAKPVIATKIGGIPEKIIDGKTGLLIDPANPFQLKTAIEYCLNNMEQAIVMGQAAKQLMEEKFSFKTMIKNYEEVYKG